MKTLRQRKKEAWTQVAQAFERELGPDAPNAGMTKSGLCYATGEMYHKEFDGDDELLLAMKRDLEEVGDAGDEENPGGLCWWWAGPRGEPEGYANRAVLATILAESAEG